MTGINTVYKRPGPHLRWQIIPVRQVNSRHVSKFAATMASSSTLEVAKSGITKRKLYEKIKDAFETNTRIAVFAEYEEACSEKPEVCEKLRELNRYRNVNVALIVNGRFNDVDKEGKKLLILDETNKKRRDRGSVTNYKGGNTLREEMISVIQEWYKEHTVFVIVLCGRRPSYYYHELDNLREKTEARAICKNIWDITADSHFNSKKLIVVIIGLLIRFARKN